jgi:hypothetical protein
VPIKFSISKVGALSCHGMRELKLTLMADWRIIVTQIVQCILERVGADVPSEEKLGPIPQSSQSSLGSCILMQIELTPFFFYSIYMHIYYFYTF